MTMPSDEQKQRIMASFNSIAGNYDALNFVQVCAQRLIEMADLSYGSRILDMATGTGLVAMVAAQMVGAEGSVVGVDISPEMLARAQQKLEASNLANLDFEEGDAENLNFPDETFDGVLCASSLFFVPDMLAAAQEALRVLAPGGYFGFSSFGKTFMKPLGRLWIERLEQHGYQMAYPPIARLIDTAVCEQLLYDAGFTQVHVYSEQLGYYHPNPESRWEELAASLEGMPLSEFSVEEVAEIRAEHLQELGAHITEHGIWVDVPANFVFGWK